MSLKVSSVLGILLLVITIIVACGEGDTPQPTAQPTPTPTPASTPPVTPPPSAPAPTDATPAAAPAPTTAPTPAAATASAAAPTPAPTQAATPTAVPTPAAVTPVPVMQPMGTLDVSVGALGAAIFVLKNQFFSASRFDEITTHESPFARDPRGTVVPRLVKNWSVDPRGLVYTFELQENVPWHSSHGDWGNFSADDFLFSLQNTGAEESIHSNAADIKRTFFCDGSEVVTTGDMTVQLTRHAATPRITWDLTALLQLHFSNQRWRRTPRPSSPAGNRS